MVGGEEQSPGARHGQRQGAVAGDKAWSEALTWNELTQSMRRPRSCVETLMALYILHIVMVWQTSDGRPTDVTMSERVRRKTAQSAVQEKNLFPTKLCRTSLLSL